MELPFNADLFYEYEALAINQPNIFLESLSRIRKKNLCPRMSLELNTISAYMVSGQLSRAKAELDRLNSVIQSEKDSFLRTRFHLLRHILISLTETGNELASEELDKLENTSV